MEKSNFFVLKPVLSVLTAVLIWMRKAARKFRAREHGRRAQG